MPNPKLPPILINKAGSVYYVYTLDERNNPI